MKLTNIKVPVTKMRISHPTLATLCIYILTNSINIVLKTSSTALNIKMYRDCRPSCL